MIVIHQVVCMSIIGMHQIDLFVMRVVVGVCFVVVLSNNF